MRFELTPPDSGAHARKSALPNAGLVCWSRMQAESGQAIELIIQRKEQERLAGSGTFFWGIGNPPPKGVIQLAKASVDVKALFSVMKGRPQSEDASPQSILVWNKYIDLNGRIREIPEASLVTSKSHSKLGIKKVHYALICYSETPLVLTDQGPFEPLSYRNAFGNNGRVGFSQVTALLQPSELTEIESGYRINLSARLAFSYWVRHC